MSRNDMSHFNIAPQVTHPRSTWTMSPGRRFTMNVGKLVPFFCQEVLPGDTVSIDTAKVVRLQTPLTPFMDNLYMDSYYFFVPNRLVWEHWKEFMGENTQSAWIPQTEYTIPQMTFAGSSYFGKDAKGSPADYLGVPFPAEVAQNWSISVSDLPFRCYDKIWNEWFRDQNLQDPALERVSDANSSFTTSLPSGTYNSRGVECYPVAKLHDYFTSSLPAPQKGPDVLLPLGKAAPITTGQLFDALPTTVGMEWYNATTGRVADGAVRDIVIGPGTNGEINSTYKLADREPTLPSVPEQLAPANLYADLSKATAASVNQLRMAFATQRIYEALARGGSRYTELLASIFNTTNPDARLQRSEYLGGNRLPISCMQVTAQAETDQGSLGRVGAVSLTTDMHSDFTKSFTEHGYLMGVCCVRYKHTYAQGMDAHFFRKSKFDFYWPQLSNIGEQPVYNREIYALSGEAGVKDEVFGYQEAWASYRQLPNRVMAEMRPDYAETLDSWHFADDYSETPMLSAAWIAEDPNNVDRALSVAHTVSDQLLCDFVVNERITRIMPLYSVPGLIDHA